MAFSYKEKVSNPIDSHTLMNMIPLLVALSFLTCLVAAPVVRSLAIRNGLFDLPGDLKIHTAPIPRLGGLAMMLGITAAIAVSPPSIRPNPTAITVFCGIWLLGLIDDLLGTPAVLRLAAHLIAGGALWFAGWRLEFSSVPVFDLVISALFFAFVINSMNLVDGMDGLGLTIAGTAAMGFVVLFAHGPLSSGFALSCAVFSVCTAMFIYNFPPATIFMGDSGSTLLGAVLAYLCMDWIRIAPVEHRNLVPLAFLVLPLSDAVAAIVRRIRGKGSPLEGDRRHFYDLLRQRGWDVQQILAASFFASAAFALLSLLSLKDSIDPFAVVITIFVLIGLSLFLLGSLDPRGPSADSQAVVIARKSI